MGTFSISVPGKWILAGEHSVLRGVPAVVFPLRSRTLELSYAANNDKDLILNLLGDHGRELQVLVWGVLDRACALKKISRAQLNGTLTLISSIPVGAGMGASAALCVAITRWLHFLGLVDEVELFEFARTLENLFHGESSGVDIAVSLSSEGLHYERNGERRTLKPLWQPIWFISYSGQKGITFDCVAKVKQLIADDPERGAVLDQAMAKAVAICEAALTGDLEGAATTSEAEVVERTRSTAKRLVALKEGIDQAAAVFAQWGLSEGLPAEHMQMLLAHGAYAVKPTGSGGGGYILSLWKEEPPAGLISKLIRC
jgi:mevalonate kinase